MIIGLVSAEMALGRQKSTKGTVERNGDATALGGSNLTNCSKSATTLLWYRIDTMDSLRFPTGLISSYSRRLRVRHQGKNPQSEPR